MLKRHAISRKVTGALVVATMAMSLAACGGSGTNGNTNTAGNEAGNTAESQQGGAAAQAETEAAVPAVDWTGKTINFYVTHSAGGDTDYYARLVAQNLEKQLNCNVVVTNVTGSNGAVCMSQYKDVPNEDGLTFICTNAGSMACNEASGITDFGYEAFEPVAVYGKQANQNIIVRADAPYNSFQEFVDFTSAQEHAGELNLGISTGGVAYFLTIVMEDYGCDFNIIDIGDNAERITSLLGGGCDATIVTYSLVKDYIEAGQLKTLCAIPKSNNEGNTLDVPSAADVIPNLIDDSVYACLAPKGTDPAYVQALNEAIQAATDTDEWKQTCNDYSYQSRYVLNVEDTIELLKAQRELVMSYSDLLQN